MDTQRIIDNPKKYDSIVLAENMIKLGAKRPTLSSLKRWQFPALYKYSQQLYLDRDGVFLFLQRSSKDKINEFTLTWHQSQIGSYKRLFNIFKSIFGLQIAEDIFRNAYYERLDIAFHPNLSFDEIKAGLHKDKVKVSFLGFSNGRSFTVGGPNSNQIIVYEKIEQKKVRVEYRFTKNIPISHIADCPSLKQIDWNKYFKIYHWDTEKLREHIKSSHRTSNKFRKIFQSSLKNNLIYTLKAYKENGQFDKAVLPFLLQLAPPLELNQIISKEISETYFKGFPFEKYQ